MEPDTPRCTGSKSGGGGRCRKSPMKGQKVCRNHGGASPQAKAAAEVRTQLDEAVRAVGTFGLPREIDPRDALLEEVYRTAGAVDWLWTKVRELDPQAVVWGVTERTDEGEKQKAAPSIWYELWAKERRHLTEVARVALAAGVEERKVKLAESQGALLAGVIQAVLGDLNLTAEQQRLVPTVVPRHLRLVV